MITTRQRAVGEKRTPDDARRRGDDTPPPHAMVARRAAAGCWRVEDNKDKKQQLKPRSGGKRMSTDAEERRWCYRHLIVVVGGDKCPKRDQVPTR